MLNDGLENAANETTDETSTTSFSEPDEFTVPQGKESDKSDAAEKTETGQSFFARTFQKMFGGKDEVLDNNDDTNTDDSSNSDDSSKLSADSGGSEEIIEVEAELYDAAKALGWDDDKIAKYYKEDKAVLEALATVDTSFKSTPEKKAALPPENKPAVEPLAMDDESLTQMKEQYGDEVVDNVIAPLLTKLNQTIEIVNRQDSDNKAVAETVNKQVKSQRLQEFQSTMDQLGEQYEVFGKWEKVPQTKDGKIDVNHPAFKSRDEVWRMAQMFSRTGSDWQTAVSDAVALFKGKNLETMIQANIIKQLNSRKLRFTPRPTSKKVEPAPLSGDAAKKAVIRQGLKAIGKE